MMRVLHLLGRDAGYQTSRGVATLTAADVEEYKAIALTIGRGGDYKGPIRAAAALRFGHAGFDLIHAWDPASFIVAVASGVPVVFSPPEGLLRGTWSFLAASAFPDVHVVAGSTWSCARHVKAGLPAARCHVILPAIETARIPSRRDFSFRRELGFVDEDFVVLAPGESTPRANHRLALHATAILGVMDKRYRFLVWGRGSEARSMREFGARLNQPGMLTIAERRLGRTVEFEELLSAADLALVTAHGGAPLLPAAACALAGVPIVAVDSPMIREALPGAGVLIVPPEGARPLARCLLELRENPDARRTLGATARANAQLRFDPRRFVREYAALYQRVAERHQIPTDPRHIAPAMS